MGGETFDHTISMDLESYTNILNKICQAIQFDNYLLPFRLANKKSYSDIDLIVYDPETIESDIKSALDIKSVKKINLFEQRFSESDIYYSKHLLTNENVQIDLLKAINIDFTRNYYSYGCANVFFKKMVQIANPEFKLSYLGLLCTNNKYDLSNVSTINLDDKTRLITDSDYFFKLIDLDYERFKNGFSDEFELYEYFLTSKYFSQIKFKLNSKFNHDYKRLESFRNLVDGGFINLN
jgi:hypothetical protein